MSEYDSLHRDELIEKLEARDWLLNHYRQMTDQLEADVEHYEDCFEAAKATVDRLRDERDSHE